MIDNFTKEEIKEIAANCILHQDGVNYRLNAEVFIDICESPATQKALEASLFLVSDFKKPILASKRLREAIELYGS